LLLLLFLLVILHIVRL